MNHCSHCGGFGFTRDEDDIPVCISCARPLYRISPLPLVSTGRRREWLPQACAHCGFEFTPKNGTQRHCSWACGQHAAVAAGTSEARARYAKGWRSA